MRVRNTARLLGALVVFGVVGMVGGISTTQNRSSEDSSSSKSTVLFAESSGGDIASMKAVRDSSRASGRIINGSKASPSLNAASKWRSNSFLLIVEDYSVMICGASFVTQRSLVTAAHCVTDGDGLVMPASNFWVTNGITNIAGIKAALKSGKSPAKIPELLSVTKVDRHPSYDFNTFTYDAAVLKVAKDAKYPAVPMVGASEPSAWGAGSGRTLAAGGASIAGWGNMSAIPGAEKMPDELMEAQIPVLSDAACSGPWGSDYNRNIMLCAGTLNTAAAGAATNGVDTCQGDSGGPLLAPVADGTFRLIGITSFGLDCASTTYPGIYTKIDAVRSWIESITGPASGTTSFAPVAPVAGGGATGGGATGGGATGGGATGGGATGGGATGGTGVVKIISPLSASVGSLYATVVRWTSAGSAGSIGVEKVTLSDTQSGVYYSDHPESNSAHTLWHKNVRVGKSDFCVHATNGDFSCIPFVKVDTLGPRLRAEVHSATIRLGFITLDGQVASTYPKVKLRVVVNYRRRRLVTNIRDVKMREYPITSYFSVSARWPRKLPLPSGKLAASTQAYVNGRWILVSNSTLR